VGDGELDDEAVATICALYGMPDGAPAVVDDMNVIVDRTTTTDVLAPAEWAGEPTALLERAAGICWSLGATPPTLRGLVESLAECLTSSEVEIVEAMASMSVDQVRAAAERLSSRIVVPAAGVLVGDSELGAIVVVRRRRRRTPGASVVAAAAPLSAFGPGSPAAPSPTALTSHR
jgi:hypothetical protein